MTVAFPEDPPETEPEANPMHDGPDADVTDVDHRPGLTVHDGEGDASTSVDDRRGPGPWTDLFEETVDREMVHGDGGGGGPEGITPWASIALVYTAPDGQEVRLDLDQNVGAEDFEAGLEAFERTVRFIIGSKPARPPLGEERGGAHGYA